MKYILTAIFSILSLNVYAANMKSVVGTIDQVQVMGKNYETYTTNGEAIAFIHMDELPVSCNNPGKYKRVAITSNHPAFNIVVSTALAAKAANQKVELYYLDECTLWNSNAWDFAILTTK
ncbi:hypothetical protein [Photobacterium galatheae]|uniref:Uncharacterized protein n=1 Tax=Photobacterium galatheae TaxID=1654360 RepID=A0A066RHS2_9GAMM|nr:hypothetical protein [Photobacterium galatheae]KDM89869.1 hypothetical protein EA58_20680 [Photobacterium galatheae]MCM0151164.1 hypothetical protein [Photobacterium galatheae]